MPLTPRRPEDPGTVQMLPAGVWRATADRHGAMVHDLTKGQRARAGAGLPHPVEDFLFTPTLVCRESVLTGRNA